MRSKTQKRNEDLRNRLVDLAERQIAEAGLRSIKARDLAGQAGCSVGAIYNVFDDIHAIAIEVNGRTFLQLGRDVAQALKAAAGTGPNQRLVALSLAYLDFAATHTYLWRALFELEMSVDQRVPDWYLKALADLFSNIASPCPKSSPTWPRATSTCSPGRCSRRSTGS